MIEKTVLDYLIQQNIDGIGNNVFMEVPETPPARYILIEKTGSGRDNWINNASFAVQSISRNSLLEAAQTNKSVRDVMDALSDNSNEIYACKPDSDYNFTNPSTKEYRYQAVYNIYY